MVYCDVKLSYGVRKVQVLNYVIKVLYGIRKVSDGVRMVRDGIIKQGVTNISVFKYYMNSWT